jgi:hypothetical protein
MVKGDIIVNAATKDGVFVPCFSFSLLWC